MYEVSVRALPIIEELLPWNKEHYLIFDSSDIFDHLNRTITYHGEISAVDFNDDDEINYFMMDIMSNIAYLPKAYNPELIDVVLRDAESYLSCNFTQLQRFLWKQAVGELVKRFYQHNLYDQVTAVHKYDFDSMVGFNILLKLYGQ